MPPGTHATGRAAVVNLPASSAASAVSHVRWERREPVGWIRMEDRLSRNRLSAELCHGLVQAIGTLAALSEIRVILLEGLSDVFSAGASEQALLGDRRVSVNACRDVMRAIATCPVPVVIAAQGHATGGGLLLALIADFTVLSQRSRYGLNFIRYGFTPVLGSKVLLSARFGPVLAAEMLFTGRSYPGHDIARRAPGTLAAEHDTVPAMAQDLANQIALAPRRTLELAKRQHAEPLWDAVSRGDLAEYADYVATHDSEAVLAHIRALRRGSRNEYNHA